MNEKKFKNDKCNLDSTQVYITDIIEQIIACIQFI